MGRGRMRCSGEDGEHQDFGKVSLFSGLCRRDSPLLGLELLGMGVDGPGIGESEFRRQDIGKTLPQCSPWGDREGGLGALKTLT